MTTSRSTSVALLSAALLALPGSARWDAAGHRTVAAIAWEHMTPRARARAVALLLHGPALANLASLRPAEGSEAARDRALFLNAATWADLVRNRDQAWHVYHHATWHYADFYWDAENGQPQDIPDTGPDSLNAAERIVALGATLADSGAAHARGALRRAGPHARRFGPRRYPPRRRPRLGAAPGGRHPPAAARELARHARRAASQGRRGWQ